MRFYHIVLSIICGMSCQTIDARKTVITVFNDGPEGILVSIDTRPRRPLKKNEINVNTAKNFFLPLLTQDQPYYFIVSSSGDVEPKTLLIWTDSNKKQILLSRGDIGDLARELRTHIFESRRNDRDRNYYTVSTMSDYPLTVDDRVIKIAYHGSLRPEIPEVNFIK